jgi:hypothetical protein
MDEQYFWVALQAKQSRIDFVRSDLARCFTFIEIAQSGLATGHRDAAERVLDKAEQEYFKIEQVIPALANHEDREEVATSLRHLWIRLEATRIHFAA